MEYHCAAGVSIARVTFNLNMAFVGTSITVYFTMMVNVPAFHLNDVNCIS